MGANEKPPLPPPHSHRALMVGWGGWRRGGPTAKFGFLSSKDFLLISGSLVPPLPVGHTTMHSFGVLSFFWQLSEN